jgi:hypothetical protein
MDRVFLAVNEWLTAGSLLAILGHLEYLHARAIPVSRSKAAWATYRDGARGDE